MCPERMARRERREVGEGERARMKGCEEGGTEANAESSVSRRLVGVREVEEDLLVLDMVRFVVCFGAGLPVLWLFRGLARVGQVDYLWSVAIRSPGVGCERLD